VQTSKLNSIVKAHRCNRQHDIGVSSGQSISIVSGLGPGPGSTAEDNQPPILIVLFAIAIQWR